MSRATSDHDDIPADIDFSVGTHNDFYRRHAKLNLPVYLEPDVQAYLTGIASKKGVPVSELANDLLRKEIAILETVK